MRKVWMIIAFALVALLGCEKFCEVNPELCAPMAQEDREEPQPPATPSAAPSEPPPVLSPAMFTWHRDDAILPESTSVLSLEAICVNQYDGFVFASASSDFPHETNEIALQILWGEHVEAITCYVLLRQNEQELPDSQSPSPGRGTYQQGDMEYEAPVLRAGHFTGFWKIDRHHELPPE